MHQDDDDDDDDDDDGHDDSVSPHMQVLACLRGALAAIFCAKTAVKPRICS